MSAVVVAPVDATADMRWLTPLPGGRWRLRMRIQKKKIDQVFACLDEAMRIRDAIRREVADEKMIPVDGESLVRLGPSFLRKRQGNRGIATERSRWERHIATAAFAQRPVKSIARRDILDWLEDLKAKTSAQRGHSTKPIKFQTRKHCLNLLRRFFDWAVDREYVASNPARGVTIEREDGDEDDGYQESWYLDASEQSKLLDCWDAFEKPFERMEKWLVAFAIGAGLRQGEQWCLHLADVHLEGPSPYVEVKYGSWDAKEKRYRSPKGRKGEKKTRRVDLFGLALDAMTRWLAILNTYAPSNPLGLVFPTRRGARRGRSKVPRTWTGAINRFGIVQRIGSAPWWHLLRHTCASSLVAGWWGRRWSLEDVRPVLGHSSVTVTERYAHLAESVVQEVATQAQAAWLGTRGHSIVTNLEKPRRNSGSSRSSKPGVVSSNLTGRATEKSPRASTDARGSRWPRQDTVMVESPCTGLPRLASSRR